MSNHLYDALFTRHEGKTTPFLYLKDGTSVSFAAFIDLAARFAGVLGDVGVGVGDRVCVQIDKSPEALAVYCACVRAGAVFLPLNTAYTADEVAYFVGDSEAKLLLASPKSEAVLAPVAEAAGARLMTLGAQGTGSFAEAAAMLESGPAPVDRGPDDIAAFLYTSGTTGRSKGAMLSHSNLRSNAEVLVDYWGFGESDRLLHALPIFHTHGLFVATNICLLAGCPMTFLPGFSLDDVIGSLPAATCMMGVPTFYTRLLDDPRFDRALVSHMRLFVSGSAPLLAETHTAFEARTGHKILERYGMTETNMNTSNPLHGERRAGTVGHPLPGVDLKIAEPETGAPLADGETGMIEVRGPNVFKGYWRMPEKTRAELRDDGFFITGDLGFVDPEGYLHIVGRAKDLIISGGYNIYPKEIEQVLEDVDGVRESAVVGVPHPDFGEGVVGVLVQEPGASLDLDAVMSHVRGKLARFKHPKRLVVVEDLPRNAMGKVQKNILRDAYADSFRAP